MKKILLKPVAATPKGSTLNMLGTKSILNINNNNICPHHGHCPSPLPCLCIKMAPSLVVIHEDWGELLGIKKCTQDFIRISATIQGTHPHRIRVHLILNHPKPPSHLIIGHTKLPLPKNGTQVITTHTF